MTNYSYEYTIKICDAIEQFTAGEEKVNPKIFHYKGSNLKFAIERAMYFRYVNDDRLFSLYGQVKSAGLGRVTVNDQIERQLLSIMLGWPEGNIGILEPQPLSPIKNLLLGVRRVIILLLGLHHLARMWRQRENKKRERGMKPTTVFCIDRERFVRYLEPISSKMQGNFLYLTYDTGASKYMQKNNIPHLEVTNRFYFLERWARKKDLLYKFMIYDKYDFLEDSFARLRPKYAVAVEGNAPHDEITNQICKKYQIQSVCIQQGWSPVVHNGFRNMTYSKMLVWGQGFADLLKELNPNQRFVVTGSHNVKVLRPELSKAAQSKVIFLIQETARLFSKAMQQLLVDLACWIPSHLNNIRVIAAGRGVPQVAKELEGVAGIEIVADSMKVPLQKILDQGYIIVSAFSTVILDGLAAGKFPIIFNMTPMPNYSPDVHRARAGIEVKNLDEAKQVMQDLSEGKIKLMDYRDSMEKFRDNFFAYNTETAVQNIIREMS